MSTNESIDYIEVTGPVTRVGVLAEAGDEERAVAHARDALNTAESPAWTDAQDWGFEVVFER